MGCGRPWNPSKPIENTFFRLEEPYNVAQAVIAKMPYTQTQLTDQALDKIKKTGMFTNNMITWNARPDNKKTWQILKVHSIKVYDAHLESGSDDDSIGSITNSINQINMGNHANISAINESMTTANSELRQTLVATQQQVDALARTVNDAHQILALQRPVWAAPPMGMG